jgi:hypothetical protein
MQIMADIEGRYEEIIGVRRMRDLRATLTELADAIDASSRLAER